MCAMYFCLDSDNAQVLFQWDNIEIIISEYTDIGPFFEDYAQTHSAHQGQYRSMKGHYFSIVFCKYASRAIDMDGVSGVGAMILG